MNKLLLLAIALITASSLLAQDSTSTNTLPPVKKDKKADKRDRINRMLRMEEEGDLIFNKHNIFGFRLATDGYGIFFEKGKYKTNTRTLIYQFELNEKKNQKEHKIDVSTDGISVNSVIVGKLNNFYQFKMAIGEQRLIGGKGNKNGVAVTALYTGGISLGILKPYLVNVISSNNIDSTFTSTYPTIIDSSYSEISAGGFFSGWNKISIKPGLNAKLAMRFDYGRFNRTISAIEAGITGEYYFSKIPQMYLVPYKNFFFNGYVSIMFGGRK
ncbi:MAG: hypothetical protein JST87_01410 [Bacteroidetes bacterium]|nr:hypothetical protein [Bacteroidota bacterium]